MRRSAFTIVELLIVIVVIAILAAITIVAYTGIQDRAKSAALASAASQASKQILAYAVENTDLYPPDEATFFSSTNLADTPDTDYTYLTSPDRTHYCLSATNPNNPSLSTAISDTSSGTVEGRCVRNLATNPSLETADIDWSNGYGSQYTRTADGSLFGNYVMAQVPNGTAVSYLYYRNTSVMPGVEYTFSVTGKLTTTTPRTLFLNVSWRDGSSTALGSVGGGEQQTLTVGQSARFNVRGVAPTGAVTAWIQTRSNSPSGSDQYLWDGVMVTEGSTQYQFADGSSSGWSWDGTPDASSSFGPALLQ